MCREERRAHLRSFNVQPESVTGKPDYWFTVLIGIPRYSKSILSFEDIGSFPRYLCYFNSTLCKELFYVKEKANICAESSYTV